MRAIDARVVSRNISACSSGGFLDHLGETPGHALCCVW